MKKTIFLVFIVIAVMISSNGCKKDDMGPQGPQGPAGTNGTDGIDGNANVIGLNTITILSEDWVDGGDTWLASFPVLK